jgi:hypothetical protein
MEIKLNKGKNLLGMSGQVAPYNAGDVVEVPDRFGRQLIATGAAVIVSPAPKVAVSGEEVQNADGAKTSRTSNR